MDKDEALKMAIEVMENIEIPYRQYAEKAINACKEALEQAEADKADLVKQCARVANEYRLDKHGHMRLVDVMMTLLLKD